jgi:D-serine deaminase-like pyridoxal phosphate-dependent protein
MTSSLSWIPVENADDINSPALLIYNDRLEKNIKKMISVAGNINLLRPHVKTHKLPEIVKLQIDLGITKFKCATIAEAEMTASCGAKDVLIAYQPVGPNLHRFIELKKKFPETKFSCIVDCEKTINDLSLAAVTTGLKTAVWMDINNGMNRTGVSPGDTAIRLFKLIIASPMLIFEGLHVYDGHIHDSDLIEREKKCNDSFLPVFSLIKELSEISPSQIKIVAGGTPTFPIHAKRNGVETSPGTVILWDYGYSSSFSDMDFLYAALLFTRVISKPAKDLICIDLGTKAVASEMPHPRIKIIGIDNYEFVSHNEEHMVIRTSHAEKIKIGDIFYCIPFHICPTVDRYDKVYVVKDKKVTEEWDVKARKRKISI